MSEQLEIKVNQLKDMLVGETGWVVPWAVSFGMDGRGYLHLTADYFSERGGSADLKITRTGKSLTDFEIDFAGNDFNYDLRTHPHCGLNDVVEISYDLKKG